MFATRMRSLYLPAIAASLLLGLLLAGCGDTPTATTAPAAATNTAGTGGNGSTGGAVKVELFEWGINPKEMTAPAGTQTFEVVNKGTFPHDFTIKVEGGDKKTKTLPANGTETLVTELPAGTYEIICSVPGHKDSGMVGTLVIQ